MTRISNDDVRRLAREQYQGQTGIDFDASAGVAIATDSMAWVAAWVRVDVDELTHPELHDAADRPARTAEELRAHDERDRRAQDAHDEHKAEEAYEQHVRGLHATDEAGR